MKANRWFLVAIALAFVTVDVGYAQPFGGRGGRGGRRGDGRFFKESKEKRLQMLKEKVGLAEDVAGRVEAVLEQFHAQRMELHEAVKDRTEAVEELLSEDSNDQEAYAAALDAVMKAREEMHALKVEEIEALRKVLTPKQQAQMLMSLRKMHHKGRGFMRGERRRGPGGREE